MAIQENIIRLLQKYEVLMIVRDRKHSRFDLYNDEFMRPTTYNEEIYTEH